MQRQERLIQNKMESSDKMSEIKLSPFSVNEVKETIPYLIPKGIKTMNIDNMWNKGIYGKGVTVAIIDTGCDINHICLKDRIIGTKNFTSEGSGNDVTDFIGHGTHVAGTIAGNRNTNGITGVAPECNLLIIKVLDSQGNGSYQNLINAINYAIDNKVDIINMSLGGSKDDDNLHNAIKKAIDVGISVVVASGNEGDKLFDTEEWSYPGGYQEVIEVGAISQDMCITDFSNTNKYIDLVAIGQDVTSCYPNNKYAKMDGTSMATPHISGALALIKEWFRKEFNREPSEMELYANLIKCTKTLNISRNAQGNGYIYFNE